MIFLYVDRDAGVVTHNNWRVASFRPRCPSREIDQAIQRALTFLARERRAFGEWEALDARTAETLGTGFLDRPPLPVSGGAG